jgi:hypothetical protein
MQDPPLLAGFARVSWPFLRQRWLAPGAVPELDARNTLIQSGAWSLLGHLSHSSYEAGHSNESPGYDSSKSQ